MFNLDQFVSDRSPTWIELERLVDDAGSRPSRLGADGVRRFGECYRATAADLALARRRFPGDPVVARLEQLVQRSRQGVYNSPSSRTGVWEFFANGYWRRVRERKVVPRDLVPVSRRADAARRLLGVARSRARRAASCRRSIKRSRNRARRARVSGSPSTRSRRWRRRSSPTTSASRSSRSRAGCCSVSARSTCCCRTACMLGVVAGLAIGAGQRPPVLRARHRARRVGAELHHRGGRGRAAARLGDHRSRATARAAKRCAKRRVPRSRSCWAPMPWLVRRGARRGLPHAVGHRPADGARRSG